MTKELMKRNITKAEREIAKKREMVQSTKMRQKYHFMAETGWMNDPNGLIYYKGRYHFFYQYNPYEGFWGQMHWGHAVSDDLLHWEYLPVALAPGEVYDDHPKGGCFSGSAIEHEGRLYLLYTGTANHGNGFVQTQCLAYSEDGIHFEKYQGNPVIGNPPEGFSKENFRDPKVWRHENKFYMVCGGQKDNLAVALLYTSDDLIAWEFVNVLAESRGEWGYMWECPDFYPIGDKYVLMFSPMGVHERTTVYLIGDMNYETGKFVYTASGEVDWGFDYYAPQSFLDGGGRRLAVGWANAWDWMPWWKDWGPTYQDGWCGWFNLPREIILVEDKTLQFKPIKELDQLRADGMTVETCEIRKERMKIPVSDGSIYEMQIWIDLKSSTAEAFSLFLRSDEKKETIVRFELKTQMMGVDRNNADGWSKGTTKSPLILANETQMHIHIYSDQNSIELFTDDYHTTHSCNVFADENQNQNYIAADNGILKVEKIQSWKMKK